MGVEVKQPYIAKTEFVITNIPICNDQGKIEPAYVGIKINIGDAWALVFRDGRASGCVVWSQDGFDTPG